MLDAAAKAVRLDIGSTQRRSARSEPILATGLPLRRHSFRCAGTLPPASLFAGRMHSVQLFIPARSKDIIKCEEIATSVQRELTDRDGAATAFLNSLAKGLWSGGRSEEDRVVVIYVMGRRGRRRIAARVPRRAGEAVEPGRAACAVPANGKL